MSGERREQPEQEISIRRRGHELFVDETVATGPNKPFSEFLRETPPTPLSAGVKAALWAVSLLAALLFAAAVWRLVNRPLPKKPTTRPAAARKVRPKSSTVPTPRAQPKTNAAPAPTTTRPAPPPRS